MGFFDKVFKSDKHKEKKKDEQKKHAFTPFVVRTDNVAQIIHDTAIKYKMSAAALDFTLLKFETMIKMDPKESDWIEVEEGEWGKFNKAEVLLNPLFMVKQIYEIEVTRFTDTPWKQDLLLQLGTNKEKNRVKCTIKSGSIIRKNDHLSQKIKNLIQKKMIYAKMLCGLWDIDCSKIVDELAAKALVAEQLVIKEDITFDVAVCFASQASVNDALFLHFQDKENSSKHDNDRIDYSKRGFIHAIEKGEIIIEYIKSKVGKPGRNCQGIFIPIKEPIEKFKPEFKVNSDAIEIEESDTHILYRAKRGGYIVFHDNTYDIKDEMEIDEVSFKKTGSIDAGTETEVKLHVSENDIMKDAIGTGVEVEAADVKVEGNIGPAASIKAEEVMVGGQTHQSSKIFAKNAVINVHRGHLKCDHAEITRLESGAVDAKDVKITQMIGGEARAMNVKIEVMGANAKVYAVSRIEIGKMVGENNKLIIDATKIDAYHNDIKNIEEEIKILKTEIEKEQEKLNQQTVLKEKSEPAINSLKKKIVQEHAKGIKPHPSFVAKIRQFQKLTEAIEKENETLNTLKEKLKNTNTKLSTFQEMVINARIINHGAWKEFTDIEFHLLHPQVKLAFTPTPGNSNEEVYLKKLDEMTYKISVKKGSEQ